MTRLSRGEWVEAAFTAMAGAGLAAVSVERLATALGATKGSFYWHFANRDDLVAAALALWRQRDTDELIAAVEASRGTPPERLRLLFARVFDGKPIDSPDLTLLADLDDPAVQAAVNGVTARRVSYVARLLRECGLPAPLARRRAVFAYAAFLGHVQLRATSPELLTRSVGSLRRYGDEMVEALLAR